MALSQRLTEGSIVYRVSSSQQHSEVEVGHGVSSTGAEGLCPLFSARGLGGISGRLLMVESGGNLASQVSIFRIRVGLYDPIKATG